MNIYIVTSYSGKKLFTSTKYLDAKEYGLLKSKRAMEVIQKYGERLKRRPPIIYYVSHYNISEEDAITLVEHLISSSTPTTDKARFLDGLSKQTPSEKETLIFDPKVDYSKEVMRNALTNQ